MEIPNISKKIKELSNTNKGRRYRISFSSNLLKDYIKKENQIKKQKFSTNVENSQKKYNNLSSRKQILATNLFYEFEKRELMKLYEEEDDEDIKDKTLLPIVNFNKISNCTILKYGVKKSTEEIEYSYCKTCDYNSLKPICMSCIHKCHYGHIIRFNFKKGNIICSCGQKNHLTMKIDNYKLNNIECSCNEWNSITNLNYYYINRLKEPICILCHYYCQNDNNHNDKIIKVKKNSLIPKCSCLNKDIHKDKRIIYEKLLNLISISNDFNILLHPLQIVNMIFGTNNNFKILFEYFAVFMEDLNNSRKLNHIIDFFSKIKRIDVEYSNIYKTLLIFEKIIEKTEKNNIYYYNEGAIKYFSFDLIKKFIDVLIQSTIDKKLFWHLNNKYLYLFHKIYINFKSKSLNKFKLQDLRYLNFFCRKAIFQKNRELFKDSQLIITFLINLLVYINNVNNISSLDAIHCLKEIFCILRKLSCYNLIRNNDMVKICSNILESFNWIRNIKNYIFKNNQKDIESKLDFYRFNNILIKTFYVIIKMLQNFIYNFNDNMIDNILSNKKKYPNLNDISIDNVCFICKKNELGEIIFKITIHILSILLNDYSKIHNKRIILIQNLAIEILQYALDENDNYILNIKNSLLKPHFDFNVNNTIKEKNKFYNEYSNQANIISNALNQYFNFEKKLEEIIEIVNGSLNIILGEKIVNNILSFNGDDINLEFDINQKMSLFYSNYPFLLNKVINILYYYCNKDKENSEYLNDINEPIPPNVEKEIIKKILYFYFSLGINSSEFSFIILSHYIFKELIKIPVKYSHILFKLFYLCFENIYDSSKNIIIIEPSFLLKRLYNYIEELIQSNKVNDDNLLFCIEQYLQIIILVIFNTKNSLLNPFTNKIKFLLIALAKKYNLIKKYFELEVEFNKTFINNYSITIKRNSFYNTTILKHKNKYLNTFKGKNLIKKVFTLYMKLINDCFDFSIEEDRKKIKDIITTEKVMYALKTHNINLELRTEFLRFLRKSIIDIKYSSKENNLYTKAILNIKDNLKEITKNPLLNYTNYPTEYLSFVKDIFNISTICFLKEQLLDKKSEKKFKKKKELKNLVIEKRGDKDINLSYEISDFRETKLDYSGFFEEYKNENEATSLNGSFSKNNENNHDNIFYNNGKTIINIDDIFKNDKNNKKEKDESIIRSSFNIKTKDDNLLSNLYGTLLYNHLKKRKRLSVVMQNRSKKILQNTAIDIEGDEEIPINEDDLKLLKEIIKINNNEFLFHKSNKLNLLEDIFNRKFYYIIFNEIDKFLQENEKLKNEKMNSIRNYIENGLLIPVIFYFKKIFIMINTFSGNEMIKLFSLLEKCLKLKIYIYENREILLRDDIDISDKFISIIDYSKIKKKENIKLTRDTLDDIFSKKISIFDFSSLYNILEIELFSLLKKKKSLKISKDCREKNKIELENLINNDKKIKSDVQKRLIKSLIIYNDIKILCKNENNSSFLSILPELNLEYETSYRNLFLSFLIKGGKNKNIFNEFSFNLYRLFYQLLFIQTEETQSEVKTIISGNDFKNYNFIKDFSKILFNKIILSLIDFLNPADKLISSNNIISCNLIMIFKYLCSKNNKFFKLYLIRSLSYDYNSNIHYFFKMNQTQLEEEDSFSEDSSEKKIAELKTDEIKNLKFYDFLLFLISKICLISKWDKSKNNKNSVHDSDDFLYNLFSSIIDLLTEIIHGNEILSILFENIKEKAINIIKEGGDLDSIKNNDNFEFFVKYISNIILDEKNDDELNKKVKKKIIDYINAIIEEKNCDENIRKCIEKYFNINKIYKIIGNIMKCYFIKNKNDSKIEKVKKKMRIEKSERKSYIYFKKKKFNILSVNNPFTKSRSFSSTQYDIRKTDIKDNKIKYNGKKQDLVENSTSEVKILNSFLDINKDIKRNLFSLNSLSNSQKNINNKIPKKNDINFEIKLSKLTFGKKLCDYFKYEFENNLEFIDNLDFQLSNSLYKFIKLIKLNKEDFEKHEIENIIKYYLKEIDTNSPDNKNKSDFFNQEQHIYNTEKDNIEKYFIEQFFEGTISSIEIITSNKENKIILFTRFPSLKYISKETKKKFRVTVNRDSETSKKYDLIKHIDYFIGEINYHKNHNNKFNKYLSKINFYTLPKLSYILAVFHNLFFLFTMKGDNQITVNETLMKRRKEKDKINNMINKSANEWDNTYTILSLGFLIINVIFILLWIVHHLPLYYKINKIEYMQNLNQKRNLKFWDKVYIIIDILILKGNYIIMLIYEFLVGLFCVLFKEKKMIYPFLLIPILYINKTLKNMAKSIQINFKPFILTFFFAFIIMYLLSNIYFFFFNSDFIREIDYYPDNYCKTLIFAFLNALDNGLRARGGMGDSAIKISYKKNRVHYLLRLLIDDIFFFLIVIIMIDMIFAIVLRSFDKLQKINHKYHLDKVNHCFICHSNRENLKKLRINYDEHVNIKHNEWNYIEFLIKIKHKKIRDLNQNEEYIFDKINNKDISWLPTYKDLILENENINLIDEKNLAISKENVSNYKIKYSE